jgi:hypothetical protein
MCSRTAPDRAANDNSACEPWKGALCRGQDVGIDRTSKLYLWGQAEATFDSYKKLVEKHLTAWQKQPDGTWKIFRNMVIPDK